MHYAKKGEKPYDGGRVAARGPLAHTIDFERRDTIDSSPPWHRRRHRVPNSVNARTHTLTQIHTNSREYTRSLTHTYTPASVVGETVAVALAAVEGDDGHRRRRHSSSFGRRFSVQRDTGAVSSSIRVRSSGVCVLVRPACACASTSYDILYIYIYKIILYCYIN